MIPESFKKYLPPLPRLFRPARPSVAIELSEERLCMARARQGGGRDLEAWFSAEIPAGAVRSSPVQQNLVSIDRIRPLIQAARDRVAPGGATVALCLPDCVTRISIIQTDSLPKSVEAQRELVSWRMKKALPFRVDEAQLAWQAFPQPDGKVHLLASVIRRRVLEQYEALLAEEGLNVGAVTTSSMALAELLPPTAGDSVMLCVGAGYFSLLLASPDQPLLYRCKSLPETERQGAERDWYVTGELLPTIEYYRRRLGGKGPADLHLHVSGTGWDELAETLKSAVDLPELMPPKRLALPLLEPLPSEVRGAMTAVTTLALRSQGQEATESALVGGAA
jgi:hypothetical protein